MSDVPTRLLRDTLRDRAAAQPSSACLDADTLAAFADDALPASARDVVETHAADCARCQALLAAMARTVPPAPAPQPAWWRRPAFGWLVPIAVTATALVVWVAAPAEKRATTPEFGARASGAPASDNLAPGPATAATPPPAALPAHITPAVPVAKKPTLESRDAKRPSVAADNFAAGPPAAPPAAPPGTPPAAARAAPPAESPAALPRIAAPDGSTAWRLLANGAVERTTDGGITWQTQATGAAVTLTAGAAPSPTICWLVGPGGTIVRTADGRSWERVAFPEATALRSVRASDALNATVTAGDGRTFTTADGGRRWTR